MTLTDTSVLQEVFLESTHHCNFFLRQVQQSQTGRCTVIAVIEGPFVDIRHDSKDKEVEATLHAATGYPACNLGKDRVDLPSIKEMFHSLSLPC